MKSNGVWKNYETYTVVVKIFEANGCFEQTVHALRSDPNYNITEDELRIIATEMFFERIGFDNNVSTVDFLNKVDFKEIAVYLNSGARRELSKD